MNERLFERARAMLVWAWDHPAARLYKKKYAGAGYDPTKDCRSVKDWERIPLLEKKDLEDAWWQDLLFLPFGPDSYITYTSGTTRAKRVAIFRARDPEEQCWAWLKAEGAPTLSTLLFIIPFTILKYHDLAVAHGILPVEGDVNDLAASARLAATLGADALHTIPTLALNAAPSFTSYYDPRKFAAISVVGEKLTPTKKTLLRELYPRAAVYAYYSSAETGTIGYQCPALSASAEGGLYHFCASKFFGELVNDELVLTALSRVPTPLIRFRTGDLVSFEKEPCACKDVNPLIRVIGRTGFDLVRSGGFELRLESFEKTIHDLRDFLHFPFLVVVKEVVDGGTVKPTILWHVVMRQEKISPELKDFIIRSLAETTRLSPRYTIAQAIQAKLVKALEVEFVREFSDSYKAPGLKLLEA